MFIAKWNGVLNGCYTINIHVMLNEYFVLNLLQFPNYMYVRASHIKACTRKFKFYCFWVLFSMYALSYAYNLHTFDMINCFSNWWKSFWLHFDRIDNITISTPFKIPASDIDVAKQNLWNSYSHLFECQRFLSKSLPIKNAKKIINFDQNQILNFDESYKHWCVHRNYGR